MSRVGLVAVIDAASVTRPRPASFAAAFRWSSLGFCEAVSLMQETDSP